ncbi:uncharacterized protein LOC131500072 [Neofelis nebulosa]|uniref:uncharacterized protein LOC131500072 n=1 Tax=Neofelis nebulosa TaxID=61452 RepID=UPI00272BA698|nr:uncharacterized protein LOC131500072 [Neofelis nebulosa]
MVTMVTPPPVGAGSFAGEMESFPKGREGQQHERPGLHPAPRKASLASSPLIDAPSGKAAFSTRFCHYDHVPWRPGAPPGRAGLVRLSRPVSGPVHGEWAHMSRGWMRHLAPSSAIWDGDQSVSPGTPSQQEASGEKRGRRGHSRSFEAEIGQRETWRTVDCHLFGQARLLPLCLGHSGGDKGASDGRLPSPQEGGRAGAAGCVCFQMKLCAWGLSGLRPHSCMSVCSACQAHGPGLPASWGQIGALLFFQGVKEHCPPLCSLSAVGTAQGAHPCEAGRGHGAGATHSSWVCIPAVLPFSSVTLDM